MKNQKITIATFLMLFISITTFSQEPITYSSRNTNSTLFNGIEGFRTWSIGVHTGSLVPMSIFGGRNDFSNWESNIGYGVNIKKQISHVFGLQADFLGGKLSANNSTLWGGVSPAGPYHSFETNLNWSASLNVVATLGNISWTQLRTWVKPYATFGVGSINYNPHLTTKAGTGVDFHSNDNLSNMYIPVGIGLKAHLTDNFNLDLGYSVGFFDGDDLDGFYKDPITNDRFSYVHAGVEFIIGDKKKPQLSKHNAPRQLYKEMNDIDMSLRREILASTGLSADKVADLKNVKEDIVKMKKDSDGDGVSDYFDKCAGTNQGTKVDGSGCPLQVYLPQPEVSEKVSYAISLDDLNIIKEASKNLQFETGSTTLKPISFTYLHRVVDILLKKELSIKLAGYTDNVGSKSANLRLSRERAESVKKYLIKQGVNSNRIEAEGYGSENPIDTNNTSAGRLNNRRVEFTIY